MPAFGLLKLQDQDRPCPLSPQISGAGQGLPFFSSNFRNWALPALCLLKFQEHDKACSLFLPILGPGQRRPFVSSNFRN